MVVSILLLQWKEDIWRTSTSTSRNTEHLTGLSMLNGLCLLHAFGEVDTTLLCVFSRKLLDGWVGKCNKRELSLPSILGVWVV